MPWESTGDGEVGRMKQYCEPETRAVAREAPWFSGGVQRQAWRGPAGTCRRCGRRLAGKNWHEETGREHLALGDWPGTSGTGREIPDAW